jgi:VIT1/CCC1 family predicted Fe2+/Mn2+ transporter
VGIYHRLLGQDLKTGQIVDEATGHTSYSNSRINKASNVITTVLASLFPVLTIYVLNQLPSTNLRIGITAAFTAVFAFMIAIFIGSAISGSNN